MRTVHFVVPDGIDDPSRPSGGNAYDRHLSRGLGAVGWWVQEHAVPGAWPEPDLTALSALESVVAAVPDDALVLVDGLVASPASELLAPHARRVRLVVLLHMPLGLRAGDDDARRREAALVSVAAAVVTTSAWSRQRVIELYRLPPERVHAAVPGVDAGRLAAGTVDGGELLCVAAVTFVKGHDLLLDALARVTDLSWRCVCVGSLDRDVAFAEAVRRRSTETGLDGRVRFAGARTGADLDRAYATADLLVQPSRSETYGMVVTEALARGVPVLAADVGGVTEALGHAADGSRPGLLVPPEDPAALAGGLRDWLGDAELRARLRRAARERREALPRWSATTSLVADVLEDVQ